MWGFKGLWSWPCGEDEQKRKTKGVALPPSEKAITPGRKKPENIPPELHE